MQRHSKYREAIITCLRNTNLHPTAERIYTQLKPDYPALSLATVYRNLTALKESGMIRSVGIIDGQEHFDAMTLPHPHAVCKCCGVVIDTPDISVPQELIASVRASTKFSVTEATLQFSGYCAECAGKEHHRNDQN